MNRDTIVPHVVRVTLFMSICRVTPSRVCELKLIIKISVTSVIRVTPSRVCGLKLHGRRLTALGGVSHPHGYVLKIMTISR